MEIRKVKTAIIGCGQISRIYLENMIRRFSILDVVGCSATTRERAKQRAEEFGIRAMSVEEILSDKEIELIVNLTPPLAHGAIIRRALEAGKHVYTEKVITPDFEEALSLKELAAEKGLRLGCAPDTFLGSAAQTARMAVEKGMIGTVTSCHAAVNRDRSSMPYPDFFVNQKGGGIGFDVGIYYLTELLSILGPVRQVCGFAANTMEENLIRDPAAKRFGESYRADNENLLMAALKFQNGVMGTLHFNSNSLADERPQLILYGTDGILELPDPNCFGGKVMIQKKGMQEKAEVPASFGFSDNSRGLGVAEMAWSMRRNRPHRANGDMGCHAVEIFSGIMKSSETGMTQTMTTGFERLPGLEEGNVDGYPGCNPESALIL